MKAALVIIVVLAAAVAAVALIDPGDRRSTPNVVAPAGSSAAGPTPPPAGTSSLSDARRGTQDPSTTPTTPTAPTTPVTGVSSDLAIVELASQFARVYARPSPQRAPRWRDEVSAWVSDAARTDLDTVVPELVPYTRVTGPATVTRRGPAPALATVHIPTDGPSLILTIGEAAEVSSEPGAAGQLQIWSIDLGGRA